MAQRASGYRLSRLALADLDGIYAYTCEHWSPQQAQRYYAELIASFEALATGDRQGRDAQLGNDVLKVAVGAHVAFYRVTDAGVDIVRILHRAMDFERHLPR
jgi:toxin ParE1/3/4